MKKEYDLIIIGGGAAGMMAAISAKRSNPDLKLAIIDRTFQLGRKILVCGAGRCNITNVNLDKSIKNHYYGASEEFLQTVFDKFGYKEIVAFFDDLGIPLYLERKTDIGKLFPITDQARTVTDLMLDELGRLGVEIFLNTHVEKIKKNESVFEIFCKDVNKDGSVSAGFSSEFKSTKVIISAGGRSYPALGSNGSGYDLARSFGHSVIHPVPSALPIEASDILIHKLQGTKMEVEVTSILEGKQVKTRKDDVMFTNYGLSGPAILNISREISIHFNRDGKNDCKVSLNFFPSKTGDEIKDILKNRWSKRPDQQIGKSLYGLFPSKFAEAIVELSKIGLNKAVSDLDEGETNTLVQNLNKYEIKVKGTRGWNEAEFTAGGVDTNEISADTLESKLVEGLYFCGEILNVDGDVGGFNLSWSWSSGNLAGKNSTPTSVDKE